ncbi:MAG TPA: zinc metalloprotease [Ferruginibacter sp.]|nr:zinc metalloprotease [Ferruginibacter sp.]
MKKIITSSMVFWILIAGCTKTSITESNPAPDSDPQQVTQRTCASFEMFTAQVAADPSLMQRREVLEAFTKNVISNRSVNSLGGVTITIPVVVNVLYNSPAENISTEQVQSQIDVLNEDYNKRNRDVSGVPSLFRTLVGNVGVNFVLSQVVRQFTSKKSWPVNNGMKKSSSGGIDATDPEHKLNIWSCNLAKGTLGFAYYPETIAPANDGVVILYSAFGSRDKYPAGTYLNDYDLGRTATHEVGHWMNLAHIWGDDGSSCSGSDFVDDTPNQASLNFGCPVFPHVSCNNQGDMSMNYMDYTDDACMFMFSKGQRDRMLAVFTPGGPRAGYIQ